jgi:hypothetical protein
LYLKGSALLVHKGVGPLVRKGVGPHVPMDSPLVHGEVGLLVHKRVSQLVLRGYTQFYKKGQATCL